MKIPTRPAPSVPISLKTTNGQMHAAKKKAPPRPPPPKFNKRLTTDDQCGSSSGLNIQYASVKRKPDLTTSLIDLSSSSVDDFGTKCNGNSSFYDTGKNAMPTIIRAQPNAKSKNDLITFDLDRSEVDFDDYSPPMPTVPPPSPPKCLLNEQFDHDEEVPHGIALYNYNGTHQDDLSMQIHDVVIISRQINNEWLYGRIGNNEGMFPANFIEICVPLPNHNENEVTVLHEFVPEMVDDLKLSRGQKVRILKRLSEDWLYGESNGFYGQFPSANFGGQVLKTEKLEGLFKCSDIPNGQIQRAMYFTLTVFDLLHDY